jgi:cation diffusion facilitator family transporter
MVYTRRGKNSSNANSGCMKPRLFIYVALVTDILITVTKFTAAIITGSSAMISEGIHSTIDSISQLLLILGFKTSKKKADARRPFGYGRELYFWSFIVSLIIFIVGGCISFYEGITRLQRPAPEGSATLDYIVLAIAFVFTGISAWTSMKAFNKERGRTSFWRALKQSKDPATFIVLLSDMGDLAGIIIAFLGIYLGHRFKNPYYDGIASMLIGVILVIISLLLVSESKSLLMGESIGRKTLRDILGAAVDRGI